jgi:hypothetical protein
VGRTSYIGVEGVQTYSDRPIAPMGRKRKFKPKHCRMAAPMEIWGNLPQIYLEAQGVLKAASAPPPAALASSGNIRIARA